MANAVLMPKAGISVETCVITEWLKQPGEAVAAGDALFSYETDKAVFECESTETGTLLERFYDNGDEVSVLTNVCAVGSPGEDVSGLRPGGSPEERGPTGPSFHKPLSAVTETSVIPTPNTAADVSRVSPRAKRLADKLGVRVQDVMPSGPDGRTIERDIRHHHESGFAATDAARGLMPAGRPALQRGTGLGGRVSVADLDLPVSAPLPPAFRDEGFEDVPLTGIRKRIALSMTQSLCAIPQLTHHFSFNASELIGCRAAFKSGSEAAGLSGVTLSDMILFAVSRLLPAYPALNAHMVAEDSIRRFRDVHLAFACDTERGLMAPVIRRANHKSLREIAREAKALAEQAQSGRISPDDLEGGTFTVSNLGTLAVESFTPVINPPQTGILGVCAIVSRPFEQNGQVKLYPAMGLSLTYDHRAMDGAPASRFVKQLCDGLEHFTSMLMRQEDSDGTV